LIFIDEQSVDFIELLTVFLMPLYQAMLPLLLSQIIKFLVFMFYKLEQLLIVYF